MQTCGGGRKNSNKFLNKYKYRYCQNSYNEIKVSACTLFFSENAV